MIQVIETQVEALPFDDVPFDDMPEIDEAEPIITFQDLQDAPIAPIRWKLPDSIMDVCVQAGQEISRSKWLIARTLQAYLEGYKPQTQAAKIRPDLILQSADAAGVDPSSIREWLHTAEVIPEGIEDEPRFALYGFSHFTRAARMGEGLLALNVLEVAQRRQDEFSPGTPPTCRLIDEIVADMKARLAGATEEELERLREEARKSSAFRFSGLAVRMESLDATVIVVPTDKQILPGDHVLVIRQEQKA
jgi:hypothetical protein